MMTNATPIASPATKPIQGGGILSAWRRAKNVTKETDEALESAASVLALAEGACLAAVVAGLVIETVLLGAQLICPNILSPLELRVGDFSATFLVALGVYFEFTFGRAASRCENEVHHRTKNRLAKAWQELSPRKLTDQQAAKLVEGLQGKVEKLLVIGRDEDEPRQYMDQFVHHLQKAGLLDMYILTSSASDLFTGISLYVGPYVPGDKLWADPLAVAFKDAGIRVLGAASGARGGPLANNDEVKKRGSQRTIYVGFKPLPAPE